MLGNKKPSKSPRKMDVHDVDANVEDAGTDIEEAEIEDGITRCMSNWDKGDAGSPRECAYL